MIKIFPYIILTSLIFTFSVLISRSFRVSQIPNGNINQCANCHVNSAGGGARNSFGTQVGTSFLTSPGSSGNVKWGPELAALDSDGDGFTNGVELQDPNGTWVQGQPAPGNSNLVTNPGDPNSKPNPTSLPVEGVIPNQFALLNNYPNPFNPSTTISFNIAEASDVRIEIFNILGEKVNELINRSYGPGSFSALWNAEDKSGNLLTSGVYIYKMTAVSEITGKIYSDFKRMILMK